MEKFPSLVYPFVKFSDEVDSIALRKPIDPYVSSRVMEKEAEYEIKYRQLQEKALAYESRYKEYRVELKKEKEKWKHKVLSMENDIKNLMEEFQQRKNDEEGKLAMMHLLQVDQSVNGLIQPYKRSRNDEGPPSLGKLS
ncbi:hypothetical protein K7X08_022854 [Anisodus acutangulus]|uniref:Uncharacterized protein n=1 Tax=Anisodus acutangulus TaxID=402998 RepID=A0A9Q1MC10_9SOLA|nr:hypothetical protein K7X08_022854 [Anisodus acutangulus]